MVLLLPVVELLTGVLLLLVVGGGVTVELEEELELEVDVVLLVGGTVVEFEVAVVFPGLPDVELLAVVALLGTVEVELLVVVVLADDGTAVELDTEVPLLVAFVLDGKAEVELAVAVAFPVELVVLVAWMELHPQQSSTRAKIANLYWLISQSAQGKASFCEEEEEEEEVGT